MTRGPFLGLTRPLATIEFVVKLDEPTEAGKRSVNEIFRKVGMDTHTEMEDEKTFIVTASDQSVSTNQLFRAERQLVQLPRVGGGTVGEVKNNRPQGVVIEVV